MLKMFEVEVDRSWKWEVPIVACRFWERWDNCFFKCAMWVFISLIFIFRRVLLNLNVAEESLGVRYGRTLMWLKE